MCLPGTYITKHTIAIGVKNDTILAEDIDHTYGGIGMITPKKRTIRLCIAWGIVNVLIQVIAFFEWMYFPLNGISPPDPNYYALAIIFTYLIVSISLFIGIRKSAKAARIKWIGIVSKALLILYSIILIFSFVITFIYYIVI